MSTYGSGVYGSATGTYGDLLGTGGVYQKAGVCAAGSLAKAADVFEAVETGKTLAGSRASGPRTATLGRRNTITADTLLGGVVGAPAGVIVLPTTIMFVARTDTAAITPKTFTVAITPKTLTWSITPNSTDLDLS